MFSTISQPNDELLPAPPLPPSMTTIFGSMKCAGRLTVPSELHLKAAFAELKLDLTEALFPDKHVFLTWCGPPRWRPRAAMFSSHELSQESQEHGPVIHLDGWSMCSDAKFISA
ncbi:MAG: hypothetical protein M3069_27245 [Chloroflexota bacterium]|nr:hypothetical protein [Chloroflexota bacterium]